jgi:molybdopterin molybdotransferase
MDIISLERAQELLDLNCEPMHITQQVNLWNALGSVLAENVTAEIDQPPFPRAPLDGYTLISENSLGASPDHPVKLRVVDEIVAGHKGKRSINPGEAVRIMTGAPIPIGADCMIRQEDTDYGEKEVSIYKEIRHFENYCFQGEDFKRGQLLLKKETWLHSAEIGILASCGRTKALVYQKPTVALITTGDEVVMPGSKLMPGKIYNSNLFTLGARLNELGIEPKCLLCVEDSVSAMVSTLREISYNTQLIITTGGVSVGKKDVMHEVFKEAGIEKIFWRVAVKPGMPTLCGKLNHTLIICLSGNPFGALANMELLVRPVLAKLLHQPTLKPVKKSMIIDCDFNKASNVTRYIRGYCENGRVTIPKEKHASGILSSMTGCNCLVEIKAGSRGVQKGEEVCVIPL